MVIPSVIQFSERDLSMARDRIGDQIMSPTIVDTCNLAIRLKSIIDPGIFFNESIARGGDRLFGHEMMNAGLNVKFNEKAIVYHHWPKTIRKYLSSRWNAGYYRSGIMKNVGISNYKKQIKKWGIGKIVKFAIKKSTSFQSYKQINYILLIFIGYAANIVGRICAHLEKPKNQSC